MRFRCPCGAVAGRCFVCILQCTWTGERKNEVEKRDRRQFEVIALILARIFGTNLRLCSIINSAKMVIIKKTGEQLYDESSFYHENHECQK